MNSGDIVADIDAALGCQRCGRQLGDSPSSDFCGESCQHLWHYNRVDSTAAPDLQTPQDSVGVLFQQLEEAFNDFAAALAPIAAAFRDAGVIPDDQPDDPRAKALHIQRHRNTGPQCPERPPRRIDARRARR